MIVTEMSSFHEPVMVNEVLKYLDIKPGKWYVDCNLGGGGHTEEILKMGGNILGIDLDQDAINEVRKKLNNFISKNRLILEHNNFTHVRNIVVKYDIKVSGVLFDLGVSSHQLQNAQRGFSFSKEAILDMRMDQNTHSATAADLVNGLHENELKELFEKLGEERFAKIIAKAIVDERSRSPITSTKQLSDLIQKILFFSKEKIHPATRIFQALRIAVNDELNNLKAALPQALEVIEPGGRIVVISFHSLEDRVTKNFFNELSQNKKAKILTNKPVESADEEIFINPRARSAKLRVLEKI